MKQFGITVYWFANGIRVVQSDHEFNHNSTAWGECTKREFESIEHALKELTPSNRAVPTLKYMQDTQK